MAAFCRLCCGNCFGVKREGVECKSLRRLKREYEQTEPAEAGTTNRRDGEQTAYCFWTTSWPTISRSPW